MSAKILIGEYYPGLQRLLAYIVEVSGFEAKVVDNGDDLLYVGQTQTFDLILTEITLECRTGDQAVLELRRMGVMTPVIFLTEYPHHHPVQHELLEDCAVIPKPFVASALVSVISDKLSKSS